MFEADNFEYVSQIILWVILLCGLGSFLAFIERAFHVHRARIKTEDFLKGILNILKRGNDEEAVSICEQTPGPVAYLVKTAIMHRSHDRVALRSRIDDIGLSEINRMERRLVVITSVAQLAPVLGLLGTVIAMMAAMGQMRGQVPLVQESDVLGIVMQALMTTAAGLTVAIPSHAAYNLLVYKIEGIVLDMERTASEIVAFLADSDAAGR